MHIHDLIEVRCANNVLNVAPIGEWSIDMIRDQERDAVGEFELWFWHVDNELRNDPYWDEHIAESAFVAGFLAAMRHRQTQ